MVILQHYRCTHYSGFFFQIKMTVFRLQEVSPVNRSRIFHYHVFHVDSQKKDSPNFCFSKHFCFVTWTFEMKQTHNGLQYLYLLTQIPIFMLGQQEYRSPVTSSWCYNGNRCQFLATYMKVFYGSLPVLWWMD